MLVGVQVPPLAPAVEGPESLKYQRFRAFRFPENRRMVTPVVTRIPETQKPGAPEPRLPRVFASKTVTVIGNGWNQRGVSRDDASLLLVKMYRVPALSAVLCLPQQDHSFYDSE